MFRYGSTNSDLDAAEQQIGLLGRRLIHFGGREPHAHREDDERALWRQTNVPGGRTHDLQRLVKGRAGLEMQQPLCRNLHGLAGCRIAAGAGGPLPDRKGAETNQGKTVAFLDGFGYGVDERRQEDVDGCLGKVRAFRNGVDQFRFVQLKILYVFVLRSGSTTTG